MHSLEQAGLSQIREMISLQPWINNQLLLLFVADVVGITTLQNDYRAHSVETEFFSLLEFDEILKGFRDFGVQVEVFTDSVEFLNIAISGLGGFAAAERRLLVYSSSDRGVGSMRQALVTGICQFACIPTCNADPSVAAMVRNKMYLYRALDAANLPVSDYWIYHHLYGWLGEEPPANQNMIVKLAYECASVGLDKQSVGPYDARMMDRIYWLSEQYSQPVIAQKFLMGEEYEIPVFSWNEPFVLAPATVMINGQACRGEQYLDYDVVHDNGYGFSTAVTLDDRSRRNLCSIAVNCYRQLGLSGVCRVDMRFDECGNPFIIDVSVKPHLTKNSSHSFVFEHYGFEYSQMLGALVAMGVKHNGLVAP